MDFIWDENKNLINIQKHGIDFLDAVEIFNGPMLISPDTRYDYGEERYIGIGFIRHMAGVVVYVEKENDVIRVISARKATKHEERRFKKKLRNQLG